MKIGLITPLHGPPDGSNTPSWAWISERAVAAETAGFDSFVFEDGLLIRDNVGAQGFLECVSVSGALAATTHSIRIGPSVFSTPYRSPAMLAKIAETLDDISGGRFVFGLGAGNVPDYDYEAFGFPTDYRVSRFAEALEIIHALLKHRVVDYEGRFHSARNAEMVLHGPRPQGPPIIVAAQGPRMLRLSARYADAWNWWVADHRTGHDSLRPIIEELARSCTEVGRDPTTLTRCLDFYTVAAPSVADEQDKADVVDGMQPTLLDGSAETIADALLGYRALGFDEVRCDVHPKTVEAIRAMQPVVERVHAAQ